MQEELVLSLQEPPLMIKGNSKLNFICVIVDLRLILVSLKECSVQVILNELNYRENEFEMK
jgi:hypothetical protein